MQVSEKRRFLKDVARGAFGSVGLSIYLLADTFFVSKKLGILGVTVMNLTMPLFNVIEGLGLLLGMGGATLFVINRIQNPKNSQKIFGQIFKIGLALGIFFMLIGLFCPEKVARLLGANDLVLDMTLDYTRVILIGGPAFVLNNFFVSFVRNDRDTFLAMLALLVSSLWNVFADWLFVWHWGMGMFGAGVATVSAPVVSILIMSAHWFNGKNTLRFKSGLPNLDNLKASISLGLPAFLMEMSNGITIFIFNWVILWITNDYVVAAYGIVTNVLLVALALFTGTAQGTQPFVSHEYAKRNFKKLTQALRLAMRVALGIAVVLYGLSVVFRGEIIAVFNEQNNLYVAKLASQAMILVLLSLFFAAINNQIIIFLAAADATKQSIALVLIRGYLLIWLVLPFMAWKFHLIGVWLSLPIIELLAMLLGFGLVRRIKQVTRQKYQNVKKNLIIESEEV